jgi:hypothetical protein
MSTKNDEMILQLKKKVEEQKAELAKLPRTLQSETSTVFRTDAENLNLRVMSVEQLKLLKVKLHTYEMAATDLKIGIDEVIISGFSIDKWMHDIDMQISVLTRAEKEKKLKETENTLNKLLSDDKRTELELEALAKSLM